MIDGRINLSTSTQEAVRCNTIKKYLEFETQKKSHTST